MSQRFARLSGGSVAEIILLPETIPELILDGDGLPVLSEDGAFQYRDRPMVPEDAFPVEIARQMSVVPLEVGAGWLKEGDEWKAPSEPVPPPAPPIVLPLDRFFERTTEAEADEIDAAMVAGSVKIRRSWAAATSLAEGSDLWSAVRIELVKLYGEERAAALLAA